MKKLFITLLAVAGLANLALATGTYQQNQPQSGTVTYVGANTYTNVVTFPVPYTQLPVITFSGASVTNAFPLTNSITTVSNFTLVVASTNLSVNWNAYIGYPRVQVGTNSLTAGTPVTNTFAVPYAYTPIMNVEGTSTNVAAQVAVLSVTTTNFIMQSSVSETAFWGSLGVAYTPGLSTVTY